MHKATCAQCGSPCEVPFRPVEGRPIYCRDCFHGQKNTGDSRGGDRFGQRDSNNNKSFSKPDFVNNTGGKNNGELKSQLETLNAKIDRLIQAVEALANTKPVAEEKTSETVKPVAPAKVKKIAKKVKKTKK
jgi:CxxC-x17-CxxC domain-containing protein